jgi:DNA polymerase-3 subunit delta'
MIVGHQTTLEDLKKLADRSALSHSYLFFGPTMVGKKMVARALAEYLEKGEGEFQNSTLSDYMFIEPGEGSSIGIAAVREIKNFLWQKPNTSSRRTLVINDAELLTAEAQNALLKITEEPPASSLLILITSDIESLMPTILSRFQKIYFGLVPEEEMKRDWRLEIGDQKNATSIIKKSMGKPGLAWRLVNDEAFKENIALAEKFLKSPAASRRDLIKKIIEPEDFDLRKFLDAVIMVLGWNGAGNSHQANLWHKTLALYDRQTNFSLNPRLQLENLLA